MKDEKKEEQAKTEQMKHDVAPDGVLMLPTSPCPCSARLSSQDA